MSTLETSSDTIPDADVLSQYGPVGMLKPDTSPKRVVRDRADKQEGKETKALQRQFAALLHAEASAEAATEHCHYNYQVHSFDCSAKFTCVPGLAGPVRLEPEPPACAPLTSLQNPTKPFVARLS